MISPEERADIEIAAAEFAAKSPPPNAQQVAMLRRIFGPRRRAEAEAATRAEASLSDPAAGTPAKKLPAAGRHTTSKGNAA